MLQQYNDQLAELKSKQRKKQSWEKSEKTLKEELKRKIHERDQWEWQLRQEERDVEQLKGMSVGALFYSLIGKKQEKLSEEEAEVLEVKMKYEEAAGTVEDLEQELFAVKEGLAEVRYVEGDIERVMSEKVRHIMEAHSQLAVQLKELSDREALAKANAKELREAVQAGRSVQASLERAGEKLKSAANWGTYDMLGGGFIATSVKHSRIDEGRSAVQAAQHGMRRFQKELQDLERNVNVTIDIGDMLKFADYFFDGFFTDWMVQGRINNAARQIDDKRDYVQGIVAKLEIELRKEESRLAELQRKQSSLIEGA
ncbi:hypothetical protein [Paenibacillus sp. HB172176]|uniref:hypothetical protein n=1 Tax=Paenibacillus sp. HB172176 TaxID=2493690 RepID=UPI00143BA533|nr:hypothetical protein [Paenibacillus sp. HB172176]